MKPSYEELEARCAQLAAENAGLKTAISNTRGAIELACAGINDDRRGDVFRDILNAVYIKTHNETPATDAFLAEVRVEHLQSYADSIAARMKDKSLSMRQKERLNFAWAEAKAYIAELHNAQLRKGVQS
ncbi:hypothetical protein OQ939_002351 [Escherichia coli]|nr:hypothetical protein [Escherichia coli]